MYNKSVIMRAELEKVGILLDEPKPVLYTAPITTTETSVDRDEVRRVLVARGAASRDLEWLVASCPDLELAMSFVPPRVITAICSAA